MSQVESGGKGGMFLKERGDKLVQTCSAFCWSKPTVRMQVRTSVQNGDLSGCHTASFDGTSVRVSNNRLKLVLLAQIVSFDDCLTTFFAGSI